MLNKKEFVERLALTCGTSKLEAHLMLNSFLYTFKQAILNDGGVKFVGDFTVQVVDTPERKGVNPRTKKPITIKAGKRIKFTTGKALKDKLN